MNKLSRLFDDTEILISIVESKKKLFSVGFIAKSKIENLMKYVSCLVDEEKIIM